MSNEPQPGDEVLEALERQRKSAADKLTKVKNKIDDRISRGSWFNPCFCVPCPLRQWCIILAGSEIIYWILYIILLYFCRDFVGKWKDKYEFETVWRNDFKQQDPRNRTSKEKNFLRMKQALETLLTLGFAGLLASIVFMVSSIKRWSLPLLVYPVCMIIIEIIRLDILFEAGMGMHFVVYGLIQLFFSACACGLFVQIRSKMYVKGEDGRVRYVGPLGVNEYLPSLPPAYYIANP